MSSPEEPDYSLIQSELVAVIEAARHLAARKVNALMSAVYWEVGRQIVETEQGGSNRSTYGEELIDRLAADLTARFGRGFSATNLRQMRAFHLAWPLEQIQQTLSAESSGRPNDHGTRVLALADAFPLPWSAYVTLLRVSSTTARAFYEREAIHGGWSVRQLKRQIDSQFYERAALSRNKAGVLDSGQGALTERSALTAEEAIRDPYVLEFLDLKDEYSESDLEAALIERLTDFLLELGDDFAFVGRQRRLRLDDRWFRVDLVFFHRTLRCLVIIDLKVGRFSYADAGQMHMYLNYARAHWMKEGENPPVGVILAASKGNAEAHYALEGLDNTILAREYRTTLPDEQTLADELAKARQAIEDGRQARTDRPGAS